MKRSSINLLAALTLFVFAVSPAKASIPSCASTISTVMVYINGIQNTEKEADINRWKYESSLRADLNRPDLIVHLGYNQSRGFDLDMNEVTSQKIAELKAETSEAIIAAFNFGDDSLLTEATSSSIIKQNRIDILAKAFVNTYVANDTVEVVSRVYNLYTTGKAGSVLLLPHSQGNLYGNLVYTALTATGKIPASKVAIYGVASPAGVVGGTTSPTVTDYATANQDRVIDAARIKYPGTVLASTIDLYSGITQNIIGSFSLGHSLTEVYLDENFAARSTITTGVKAKLGMLANANPMFAIEATWPAGTGMRLDISEPVWNGVIVGEGSGLGMLTKTANSACYRLTDLSTLGAYTATVHNSSASAVTVSLSAVSVGVAQEWNKQIQPDTSFGGALPSAILMVNDARVTQFGYEQYAFSAFL